MNEGTPAGPFVDPDDSTTVIEKRGLWRACASRHGLLVPPLLALFTAVLVGHGVPPPPSLCLLGDARDYMRGTVSATLAGTEFDASRLTLGLGRAAIGDWNNLGEALLVGGQLCVRSTAAGSRDYYRLVCDHRFRTSAFAFLPPGARPRGIFSVTEPMTLGQLRRQLAGQYPAGVLLAGSLRFATLDTIAVSRPAIRGVSVEHHAVDYYTEPREERRDAWAYVVGVAVRQPLPLEQLDDQSMARLLAPRPGGRSESLVQALVLAATPADGNRLPSPHEAVALGRVTDESRVVEGAVDLYPLYRLSDCGVSTTGEPADDPLPALIPSAATATAP